MDLVILLAAGAVAGTIAGLMGIGGGVVIVPVLSFVLVGKVPEDILIKIAVGTSLATISVTALSSILAHHRRKGVDWQLVQKMTPGIVVGSFVGAAIADWMPAMWLTIIFIVAMMLIALQLALGRGREAAREHPSITELVSVAGGVGMVSALLGIGGGAMNVPYLSWSGVPMKVAIGTSAALGFPLAVASTVGFIIAGLNEVGLPPHSLGYVNLPAAGGIVAASILFAPLGAKLAHMLPDKTLRRGFAIFVFLLAVRMTYDLVIK